jgi:hypothetical protein
LDDDVEKIRDREELIRVRRQARRVQIKSLAIGLLLTLFAFFQT